MSCKNVATESVKRTGCKERGDKEEERIERERKKAKKWKRMQEEEEIYKGV